jgi:hypothetical protein
MNRSSIYTVVLPIALYCFLTACNRSEKHIDIPDIQSIYSNIRFLDSLVRSNQIDSISRINDQISATIRAYDRRAQSAEDVACLDSLSVISSVAHDLIRFCISSQSNLDLLEADTRSLESQYRSGKITIAAYTSALVENEQTLVDIYNQLTDKNLKTLEYLKNRNLLISSLSPLPVTVNQ